MVRGFDGCRGRCRRSRRHANPQIAAFKADAQNAIDAGELAKADGLLADVETQQSQAVDRLTVNAAATAAKRGAIASTRLRYNEAAAHLAKAAAMLPPGSAHEGARISYLEGEVQALFKQGDEYGDNDAFRTLIDRLKRLSDLMPRERVPLDWANTQSNLGLVLWKLGEREGGTERLQQAVAASREALKEQTRERAPLEWAATQTNLGTALQILGGREGGTQRLGQAVA